MEYKRDDAEMVEDTILIKNYITYISGFRRKKTVDIYVWHLLQFYDYLHSINKNMNNCMLQDISSYINSRYWGSTTKRHAITIIKGFFNKYYLPNIPVGNSDKELRYRLQRENDIRNIYQMSMPHKNTNQVNKALSLSEVKLLLSEVKKQSELDYCILYVFFYFGIRKGELLSLNPTKHIIWSDNHLHLTGDITKNYTDRNIYFNKYTRERLIYILENKGSRDRLYICDDETQINRIFAKYDYILGKHLFPHKCRHTFITEMSRALQNKSSLNPEMIVKLLAGHNIQSQNMTALYTSFGNEPKKAMLEYHYLVNLQR